MSKNSKQKNKSPNRLNAFILEPILTPSGLIDGMGDHTSDLDAGFHSDILLNDGSAALDDLTSHSLIDGVENETSDLDSELYLDVLPYDNSAVLDDFALDNIEIIPFSVETEYTSGVFTVGDSGQVRVDFLYDGGAYQGQLGIFSLRGMESLDPNSTAFIHEAATRALSNSDFGYVVINDITDGAHFSSNTNSGLNIGEQSFEMQAGDRFGFILVPNGKMSSVVANPEIGGALRPLFSLATANPDDSYHVGQIADMFGDGSTFVFEDLRVDLGSDHDYNDLVFHVKGAEGQAPTFDQLIADGLMDPNKDFRHTEIGQQIASNVESYIADGKTFPGDPIHPEVPTPPIPHTNVDQGGNGFSGVIGTSVEPNQGGALPDLPTFIKPSLTQDVIDQVGGGDLADIYRVSGQNLTGTEISVLSGSATVSLMTPQGEILSQQIFNHGTHTLNLPTDVSGDVLLKFSSTNGSDATYILQGFASQAKEPFNIGLEFASGITASQQAIIREAANTVQSMIGQGLPSAIVDGKIIDDINFKISATNLDGAGGTLAQTKIDFMRYGSLLPAQSITHFDLSDLAELERSGQLADVVTHELLHGLGFGNLWEAKGLVDYANTPLAQYNGQNAVDAFKALGGLTDAISLETDGDGSAGLHWHEGLFQDEIMTADLGGGIGNVAISAVTLASLADLGYVVNRSKATPEYRLFGGQEFSGDNLTPEQIEAFRQLAEMSFEESDPDADYEYIAPIMPTVDPDKVAPEIWAHAERFWKNGEYYDWVPYQIRSGDTLSALALRYLGGASYDYYKFIGDHKNQVKNYNYIVAGEWIEVPVWHPNYEWEQEQERLRSEEELRRLQEEKERIRREQEEAFAREQERIRQEEEARRLEAEAKQRELEEQERRLREEMERRRQEEERRLEEARLAELARQAEIARQQGKGGFDWYVAKPLPEFGPVDPFETKLTGETVGNLVPDDYYRFTLSRGGRITAELRQLLADADLVLYDVRNRPIAYSMREGITDEQIVADLIPGTYLLRVNSPKGVTTDYELIVKFKHLLSRTEQGPPPGWTVGGGTGNGVARPTFADPRLEHIFVTAVNQFSAQKWAAAQPQLNQLAAEKKQAQQDLNALLAQMIVEQKNKVYAALDNTRGSLRDQVSGQANNLKWTINSFADNAINGVNGLIPDWVRNTPWLGDRVRSAQDAIRDAVNGARNSLNGFIDWTKDRVNDAIWQFVEMIKNAYITGGEINAKIDEAANWLKGKLDEYANSLNNKIGEFKGWILGGLGWTRNIGVGNWNVYDNAIVPFVNGIANNVQGSISGVSNFFKGFVDVAAPLAQKAVAVIVDSLFGDQTGNLYNKINGVDAKVAAIKNNVQNAINSQKAVFKADIEKLLSSLGLDGKKVLDTLLNFGNSSSGQMVMVLAEVLLGLIPGVGQALDVKDTAAALYEIFVQGNNDVWAFIGLIGALAGWVPLVGDSIKGIAKIARKGIDPLVDLLRKIGPDVTKAATKAIADTNWANLLKNLIANFKGKWNDFNRALDGSADWVINALGLRPAYATANNGMLSLFSKAEDGAEELTPVQRHFLEVMEQAKPAKITTTLSQSNVALSSLDKMALEDAITTARQKLPSPNLQYIAEGNGFADFVKSKLPDIYQTEFKHNPDNLSRSADAFAFIEKGGQEGASLIEIMRSGKQFDTQTTKKFTQAESYGNAIGHFLVLGQPVDMKFIFSNLEPLTQAQLNNLDLAVRNGIGEAVERRYAELIDQGVDPKTLTKDVSFNIQIEVWK